MKTPYLFFIFYFLFIYLSFAQKHDYNWLMGYESVTNTPSFGISTLDFNIDTVEKKQIKSLINFYITNASMSDKDGKLLFYSNGIDIADASHKKMKGAPNPTMWDELGEAFAQGCLILPYPGSPSKYLLFNLSSKWVDLPTHQGTVGASINYFEIDMTQNNNLGAVTKIDTLLRAYIERGNITATKHANGRDWWLLIHSLDSNEYYRYLISPEGIHLESTQIVGIPTLSGLGQSVFSPDGSFYVHYSAVSKAKGVFLDIYDFDRCTGLLSNQRQLNYLPKPTAGGVAISPNSRFLYVSNRDYLDQYDLNTTDIFATRTKVAEYDGFKPPTFSAATSFFMLQLAPNGKIYGCNTNGTKYLHIIHQPDSLGLACKVEQHGLLLPTLNAQSLPNFPNYRLGALKGSACDTLKMVATQEQTEEQWEGKIYPNPAQDVLHIEYPTNGTTTTSEVTLFDIAGKAVLKVILSTENTVIDVRSLPTGLYLCKISDTRGGVWYEKMSVVR
jgi:hypothetical protein